MSDIRLAEPSDVAAVARVIEGALLEVPIALDTACGAGRVLVVGDPIYGAAAIAPSQRGGRLVALAVTPARRGEGVATRLLEAALERWQPLSATIDTRVLPVYEALDFALYPVSPDRYRAVRGH
jgi:GNAT superfamily N-acetyltransferase